MTEQADNKTPNGQETFIADLSERTRLFVPEDVYKKSCESTVAIAGAGGVGGLVIELLARWGIRRFRLADGDRFEPSNLNRQILATVETIGRSKAEVAVERVRAINPFAEIQQVVTERLGLQNLERFADGVDLLIDETDSYSCYVLLDQAARKRRIPLVSGHGMGPGGFKVYVFDYRKPNQRGLENPFRISFLNSLRNKYARIAAARLSTMNREELEAVDYHPPFGSIGFTVGLCACWVAAEAIKLLTGLGKVQRYPKEIVLDVLHPRLEIRTKYSLSYILGQFLRRRWESRR
ncbi:MAG: HesA/MoeB/ThiF family protein [Kiritimatiellia bacterium]